jgi:hypothetical protein
VRLICPTILVTLMAGTACMAPPPEPGTVASMPAPEQPTFPRALLPDAPAPPPLPASTCAARRVFANLEDLCAHAIVPSHPYGRCGSQQLDDVAALGGHVELVSKDYNRQGSGSEYDILYLVLRSQHGYELLAEFGTFDATVNGPLEIERFVGDAKHVEIRATQVWYYDEDGEYGETTRVTSMRCIATPTGIRCNDACPTLGLVEPTPKLACAALASVDWSALPRGENVIEHYQYRADGDVTGTAMDAAGIEDEFEHPIGARQFELGRERLTVLQPVRGKWVLLHGQTPLVVSTDEIRVGTAPGGLYLSSRADGERQIQRLNLGTHELEAVLPGACGSLAP